MEKKKRTFWIIVAALGIVIITMPTALAGSELIINGGFESGDATGWTLIGSSVTSNDKYSGTYSVNFHYAAASASQEFSPAVSTSGDLTFWVKCICIYDCSMLVSVRYNDGSFSNEIIPLSRDTWQQITYSIDNSKQLERVFFGSGARLYIDDVSLKSLQVFSTIDIEPDTLNLKSNGEWITAYIELPEGYDVNDIDVSTIYLVDTIPVDTTAPATVGDYDGDGTSDLMVKFDRTAVIAYLGTEDVTEDETGTDYYEELTLTGELTDGTPFEGSDTIRVIDKGKGK